MERQQLTWQMALGCVRRQACASSNTGGSWSSFGPLSLAAFPLGEIAPHNATTRRNGMCRHEKLQIPGITSSQPKARVGTRGARVQTCKNSQVG